MLLHPEDVRAGIRKKYGTLRAFERAHDLPVSSTRDVLRGRSVKRTAEAIASVLGFREISVSNGLSSHKKIKSKADNKSHKRDMQRLNAGAK